ncbi:MAG: IS4 family transposase [Polyangiales bacterium]
MDKTGYGNERSWAEATYGGSTLPDKRLEKRLVSYASAQMAAPTQSTAKACRSSAEREGAYRLLENERVTAEDILEGPIRETLRRCRAGQRVLVVQDTSSVEVAHQPLREALKEEGSPTGWHSHVALAVDPERRLPIGVLAMHNWIREPQHARRRQRASGEQDKESLRWQQTAEQAHARCTALEHELELVTVADREADMYELMAYHEQAGLGYVLRAKHARKVRTTDPAIADIREALAAAPVLGTRSVHVAQRGGQRGGSGQKARGARKAEVVQTELRACELELKRPANLPSELPSSLKVTVVQACSQQQHASGKPVLDWVLLSSEPVQTQAEAEQVVQMYECRWLIEEVFRGWKSGCRLEERPLQSVDAVERMMAILLPMAVRLLCLRELREQDSDDAHPVLCDQVLETDQWQCLWLHTETGKALPEEPPRCRWAYLALAKLGGFCDSKRTGRASWNTLWDGLLKLNNYVIGFRLAKAQLAGPKM